MKSSTPGVKSASTLDAQQKDIEKNYLYPSIKKAFEDDLFTRVTLPPELENLYKETLSSILNQPNKDLTTEVLLDRATKPSYTSDPEKIKQWWNQSVATPVMDAWNTTVGDQVREKFGGNFFNSRNPLTLARAANEFYGSSVMPTLFNAQMQDLQMGANASESAAARSLQAVPIASNAPNLKLESYSNAIKSYLGTKSLQDTNTNQALNLGFNYLKLPTIENYAYDRPSTLDQIGQATGIVMGMGSAGTSLFGQSGNVGGQSWNVKGLLG